MVEKNKGVYIKNNVYVSANYRRLQNLVLNKDETLHFDQMIKYEIRNIWFEYSWILMIT